MLIEVARVKAREESRPPLTCRRCGEGNRIPLAGTALCYRCRMRREEERDHPRGSGSGPAVLRLDSNDHRITNESERIWQNVEHELLCAECAAGFPMRIGILLARLEVAS
jgi:hypothetical protein